jgi:hypothetical protein
VNAAISPGSSRTSTLVTVTAAAADATPVSRRRRVRALLVLAAAFAHLGSLFSTGDPTSPASAGGSSGTGTPNPPVKATLTHLPPCNYAESPPKQ